MIRNARRDLDDAVKKTAREIAFQDEAIERQREPANRMFGADRELLKLSRLYERRAALIEELDELHRLAATQRWPRLPERVV